MLERLESDEELREAFSVMRQLRTHLSDVETFIARVRRGEQAAGYTLFAWRDGGKIVALCGVQAMVTLYYDNCLWVSDLVVDETLRGGGFGGKISRAVETWARENGFREIALTSGVQRLDAHRFYQKHMDFTLSSHCFVKKL